MDGRRNRASHGAQLNDARPFVRVVVPAFNKAELTTSCFRSLLLTDWPRNRLDLVLVDNGSSDEVSASVSRLCGEIRVVSAPTNLGFAGGCNLGILAPSDSLGRPLSAFDYLALINNDAVVDPSWLEELVAVAEAQDDVGVVSAKILLAPRFSEVVLAPVTRNSSDDAYLEIRDVLVNGSHQDQWLKFDEVFVEDPEVNSAGRHSFWVGRRGAIRVVDDVTHSGDIVVQIELSATSDVDVQLRSGPHETMIRVPGRSDSVQVEVQVHRECFDVLNSAGGELYRNGSGGDRGYLERDSSQFDEEAEVFSWCGAGALVRRSFLDEVGLFDERLFLYYEDFDLSWRGRLAGWRYVYAPRAVIRHHHAQTSVAGSELFRYFTSRNRLLVLTKNAPWGVALRSLLGEIQRFLAAVIRIPTITNEKRRRQQYEESVFRAKVLASYFRHAPWMLVRRWRMVRRMDRSVPMSWLVEKRNDPGFLIDGGRIKASSRWTRI